MNKVFDLEDRTARFGADVINLCKSIKENSISRPVISQLVRSATSIGANYMEANGACSKKDFKNKIYICKKETQETKHWLKMIVQLTDDTEELKIIQRECQELSMIFGKISSSLNLKD